MGSLERMIFCIVVVMMAVFVTPFAGLLLIWLMFIPTRQELEQREKVFQEIFAREYQIETLKEELEKQKTEAEPDQEKNSDQRQEIIIESIKAHANNKNVLPFSKK